MGGAADLPLRSSSPLKRRASNLEGEAQPSQREDVDMLAVPELASLRSTVTAESRQHPGRTPSVQMLAEENNIKADPTSENRAMTGRLMPVDYS
jgi:ubiquitin carboxyl-terminal hydrolase 4/11/15